MKLHKYFNQGYTLVEVAVAMGIMSVTMGVAIGLAGVVEEQFPQTLSVDGQLPPDSQLSLADAAVLGFVLTNNRLPCPADPNADSNHRGYEALVGVDVPQRDSEGNPVVVQGKACQLAVGDFPEKTLAMDFPVRLRYGVSRDTVGGASLSLANTQRSYTPFVLRTDLDYRKGKQLLPSGSTETPWPWSTHLEIAPPKNPTGELMNNYEVSQELKDRYQEATEQLDFGIMSTLKDVKIPLTYPTSEQVKDARLRINGLDFCATLRTMLQDDDRSTREFAVGSRAPIAVAYALAHPGTGDKDQDGNPFDGGNVGSIFELPGAKHTESYDDSVLSVSLAELSGRLQCPKYLARAEAAASSALAAYDNFLFALGFLEWQDAQLDSSAVSYLSSAASSQRAAFNTINLVLMNEIRRIDRFMTRWPDEKKPIVDRFRTVYEYAYDKWGEVFAQESMERAMEKNLQTSIGYLNAVESLKKAKKKRIEAEEYAMRMRELADQAAARMIEIDERGLQL